MRSVTSWKLGAYLFRSRCNILCWSPNNCRWWLLTAFTVDCSSAKRIWKVWRLVVQLQALVKIPITKRYYTTTYMVKCTNWLTLLGHAIMRNLINFAWQLDDLPILPWNTSKYNIVMSLGTQRALKNATKSNVRLAIAKHYLLCSHCSASFMQCIIHVGLVFIHPELPVTIKGWLSHSPA